MDAIQLFEVPDESKPLWYAFEPRDTSPINR